MHTTSTKQATTGSKRSYLLKWCKLSDDTMMTTK